MCYFLDFFPQIRQQFSHLLYVITSPKATRIQSHVLIKYLMYSIEILSQRCCICCRLNGDFLLERKCFDAIALFSLTFITTNKYLFQLLEIDCLTALSQLLQDEKMIDLMMEAGYQNFSFKLVLLLKIL